MTEEARSVSRWVVDRYIKTRSRMVVDIGCALEGKSVLFEEKFPTPVQRIFGGSSKKVDEGKTQR